MAKNAATVKIPSTYAWLPLVSPSNFIKGLKGMWCSSSDQDRESFPRLVSSLVQSRFHIDKYTYQALDLLVLFFLMTDYLLCFYFAFLNKISVKVNYHVYDPLASYVWYFFSWFTFNYFTVIYLFILYSVDLLQSAQGHFVKQFTHILWPPFPML